MDNMTYELFIRQSWNVERFKKGANTDTWDGLIWDFATYTEAIGTANEEKSLQKFEKRFSEVKKYVGSAFGNLLKEAEKVIPAHADLRRLTQLSNEAADSENPQELYNVLDEASNIMGEHKLIRKWWKN